MQLLNSKSFVKELFRASIFHSSTDKSMHRNQGFHRGSALGGAKPTRDPSPAANPALYQIWPSAGPHYLALQGLEVATGTRYVAWGSLDQFKHSWQAVRRRSQRRDWARVTRQPDRSLGLTPKGPNPDSTTPRQIFSSSPSRSRTAHRLTTSTLHLVKFPSKHQLTLRTISTGALTR